MSGRSSSGSRRRRVVGSGRGDGEGKLKGGEDEKNENNNKDYWTTALENKSMKTEVPELRSTRPKDGIPFPLQRARTLLLI